MQRMEKFVLVAEKNKRLIVDSLKYEDGITAK
jgi:hypothetical protein